jgi:cell division protein FtsB
MGSDNMAKKRLKVIRRNRFVLLGILIGIVACLLVWTNQEVKLQEMAYEQSKYEAMKQTLTEEVESLRAQVEALDTDEVREQLAREKLKMIKKDEILYIIKAHNQ